MKKNEFRTLKADEIKVRVGTVTSKGATMLLYTEARTVMDILDETVGPENWESDYKEVKGVVYGGVGIYDETRKETVWKWDAGTESFSEASKGEASDAFKRSAVKWGISRELYKGPKVFVSAATEKNGDRYFLSEPDKGKLTYNTSVKEIEYDENRNITKLILVANWYDSASGTWKNEVVYSFPKKAEPKKAETKKEEPKKEEPATDKSAKITKGGVDYLTELMKRTKVDQSKLLEHYGVTSVEEMTVASFEECSKILESRLA